MNAKHTPLEIGSDITGPDVLFNPDQDILTPIESPSAGRAVMWVDRTPWDEMEGFAEFIVRAVNAHDDLKLSLRRLTDNPACPNALAEAKRVLASVDGPSTLD